MELKALVGGLFLSLLVLWNVFDCVQTHQDATETVINLLEALNVTHSSRGVSKVKGRDPKTPAWRFRSNSPHLKLPQTFLDCLFNTSQGVLGLHLVGRQSRGSEATLISFTSSTFLQNDERPLLELVSNTKADWLQLEFRSADGLRPEVLKVPGGSPFTSSGWVRMALSVEPRQLVLYVECQEAVVLKLKEGGQILTLDFPHDLQVIFSSTARKKASKFIGGWQTAELSTRAYEKRPWSCDNVTDSLPDTVIPTSSTVPAIYDLDMMQDQGDRGDGIVSATRSPAKSNVRLDQLENSLYNIKTMLDMLKRQNTALQTRVDYLETCECSKRKCVWEGREMNEGSRWSPDSHTVCYCTHGKVQCDRLNECSFHGNIYSNGDVFSPDDCNRCTCEHGRVECNVNPCPSRSCQQPPAPQTTCCPACQTRCEHEGEIYENGKQFMSRSNPCLKCSCSNGQVACDPIQCPPTLCPTPYKRPGECCPTCSTCIVGGRPYNGSFSTIDGCQTCSCQGGNQACVDVQQCPQTCQDGVKPPFGSCCKDCSRCNFEGQVILDGVSVQPSRDPCKRCVCNSGNIVCNTETCSEIACNLVETVGGQCCPRCRSCVQDSVRHQHGSQWKLPNDPCTTCACTEGLVQCESERCNIRCNSPATAPPGSCCPVCDGCSLNGIDIPNGMTLPPGPTCDPTCKCENGNINCIQYPPCPPTPCQNPVRKSGECCARCVQECTHEGEVYTDGQTFVSRQDPCLRCQCSGGQVSCESATSSCPSTSCTHPTKPHNQCCPTCNTCEYEERVYENGEEFRPPGGGPCIQCLCKNGNVRCHQERCPHSNCAVPTPAPPNTCCPVCRGCTWNGVQYEEGATWTDAGQTCSCASGQVRCSRPNVCPDPPRVPCQNPPGGDSCGQCQYKQRMYANGQTFRDPDDACKTCTCQDGQTVCGVASCPAPTCANAYTPPGECCPQCPGCTWNGVRYDEGATWTDAGQTCFCVDGQTSCSRTHDCANPTPAPFPNPTACMYDGREYQNGQEFLHPADRCSRCMCRNGQVTCNRSPCPNPGCSNPITRPGQCCPVCDVCMYDGREYQNGQEFPDPADRCSRCMCRNGQVTCSRRPCPNPGCSNPITRPGQCCPVCDVCIYDGQEYQNGQDFPDPADRCSRCVCRNFQVTCNRRPCPNPGCSNPITRPGQCCPVCDVCMYDGREYQNGQEFPDPADRCSRCMCRNGQVTCSRSPCPNPGCSNPITRPGQCCPVCDVCIYDGREYQNGQEFLHPADRCGRCVCRNGQVTCNRRPCPNPGCSNPITRPGQCCPVCDVCMYDGREYQNGQEFPDPADRCSRCMCRNGQVTCSRSPCPNPGCSNPITRPGQCCPVCDVCIYDGREYQNGQEFPDPADRCSRCMCRNGQVTCSRSPCPNPGCSNPITRPGQCCPVCDVCIYDGQEYQNGQVFPDPADRCSRCMCRNGQVTCSRSPCPNPGCSNPITRPGQCCPVCDVCIYDGREYQNGQEFPDPADRCSRCMCRNGQVTCSRSPCPNPGCSNPITRPGQCCPVCDVCIYDGREYQNGQEFPDPADRCSRCMCRNGQVTCNRSPCPNRGCSSPITRPGQCCPVCDACFQQGREYLAGQSLTLPDEPCIKCTCVDGEVNCVGPDCPKLTCTHQVTDPGSCCPRCRGCIYDGVGHLEGSTWFAPSSPCMSCMCVNGVTTCSEVHCLSTCLNQISVAGECCPVCADCVYEGHVYGPGESFHPSDDPCQICTCEVMPDGEQHMRCYRKQCPSLVDCPKDNILYSGSDSCCPVCAQPLSNCTAILIGNEVLATGDPCFTCQCKDLTWTCIHRGCPPLSCPPADQHTPPDSCCPVCDECVLEGNQTRVPNGQRWIDKENECVTCTCNQGHIECDLLECPPLDCPDGSIKVKNPGKCCPECTGIITVLYTKDAHAQCVYNGQQYNHNDHWEVDECTSCTCVYGEVHCQTQRCPTLTCASDETPSLVPGMCCPHCIPHPATCIVFGDPHYRTFDGKMVNFQGKCTYVLAQDCEGGDFSVHVSNEDRGRKGVSWTKEVTVFIGDIVVQLFQNWIVKVDYQQVSLPFLKEPYVYLERKTNTILLNTNVGLKVLWNGRSHLEVSVPGTYKKHMCGLCGNFNNYPQDDMKLRNGQITNSEAVFGNNWKVGSGNSSVQCPDAIRISPCKEAGYSAHKTANTRCTVLKSPVFERCHKLVPPEMFYASCVYDLCACGSNTDECLCDVLEAYASECREAGVILQWRSPTLCAVGCPLDRGYVFDECGPPCPKTCFNKDVPLGVIEAHCFKPCVPGCQCPAGLVEHNAHCIARRNAPKLSTAPNIT
ncbi:hypothetical protein G5714_017578 [Onychostoma macrolepis]|uniref:Kielin/chordin-like protein n=1 Tax=Onychostoma macrolepis TaxID=369639 RepID=A0A7J6C1P4_9TELE|nr:hypothetical protein G5714_017578 [Onychostoma macrolepis]